MARRLLLQRWLLASLIAALAIGGDLLSECCALVELCREGPAGAASSCCSAHDSPPAMAAGASCHAFRAAPLHGHAPTTDPCGCRAHEDTCTADLGGVPALVARKAPPADGLAWPVGLAPRVEPGAIPGAEVAGRVSPGARPLYRLLARIRC